MNAGGLRRTNRGRTGLFLEQRHLAEEFAGPSGIDAAAADRPYVLDFSSGYIQRVLDQMPKQGIDGPWTNPQDYKRDRKLLRKGEIDDGALIFDTDEQRCA